MSVKPCLLRTSGSPNSRNYGRFPSRNRITDIVFHGLDFPRYSDRQVSNAPHGDRNRRPRISFVTSTMSKSMANRVGRSNSKRTKSVGQTARRQSRLVKDLDQQSWPVEQQTNRAGSPNREPDHPIRQIPLPEHPAQSAPEQTPLRCAPLSAQHPGSPVPCLIFQV